MKRVGPVLLLALVLGGISFLAKTGKLSLINGANLKREGFTLKYTAYYTGCQHEKSYEEDHPRQTWPELLAKLTDDGWVITNFARERVEAEKQLAKLCPQCAEKEFIGVYGNEIGVFAGSPEQPGPLKQVIPVNISRLPQAEIDDLKAGIVCDEAQDKWRILESYQN